MSGGRQGGLGAAHRQVSDGGKCLWLITPWKMPGVSGAVTDRGFGVTLVLRDRTDAGSMQRKRSELGSCRAPPGRGRHGSPAWLWSAGTCRRLSGEALCQKEMWPAPCLPAPAVPPCYRAMGRRRARLHQSLKTSAWRGSCWAAHAGSAHTQTCGLQRPSGGLWRCQPRFACQHMLECSPCHVHVRPHAKVHASKARVHTPPPRTSACPCLLVLACVCGMAGSSMHVRW